jgi:hypothetical protein
MPRHFQWTRSVDRGAAVETPCGVTGASLATVNLAGDRQCSCLIRQDGILKIPLLFVEELAETSVSRFRISATQVYKTTAIASIIARWADDCTTVERCADQTLAAVTHSCGRLLHTNPPLRGTLRLMIWDLRSWISRAIDVLAEKGKV